MATNDVYVVVESGLEEGDEVVLNPRAFIEEAKNEVMETIDEVQSTTESEPAEGDVTDESKSMPKAENSSSESKAETEKDSAS